MNEKTMSKCKEVHVMGDIDNVVKELLVYKDKGEKVFCEFNGKYLYSETVTIDSAYLEILGKTKKECDKKINNSENESGEIDKTYKKSLPKLIGNFITEGLEIIEEQYWGNWIKFVRENINSLFKDDIVLDALNTLKVFYANKDLNQVSLYMINKRFSGRDENMILQCLKECATINTNYLENLINTTRYSIKIKALKSVEGDITKTGLFNNKEV